MKPKKNQPGRAPQRTVLESSVRPSAGKLAPKNEDPIFKILYGIAQRHQFDGYRYKETGLGTVIVTTPSGKEYKVYRGQTFCRICKKVIWIKNRERHSNSLSHEAKINTYTKNLIKTLP